MCSRLEMLTRVWGSVLTVRDRHYPGSGCGEVARNVLILQLQVRQRALTLLVNHASSEPKSVAAVDRLRRKLERWTDVLLAEMVIRDGVVEFACDPRRAGEFGIDYFKNQTASRRRLTWRLLNAGMHSCFAAPDECEIGRFNGPRELLDALICCLPQELMDNDEIAVVGKAVASGMPIIDEGPPPDSIMRRFDRLEQLLSGLTHRKPGAAGRHRFCQIAS